MPSQSQSVPKTNTLRRIAAAVLLISLANAQPYTPLPNIQGHSNIQENTFFSCLELQCPIVPDSTDTFCRLWNQTLNAVGMTQSDANEVQTGANFTWTVGSTNHANVNESMPSQMNIERIFYLGKQFEVPEDTHGCAFYMTKDTNNANLFPPPTGNETNFVARRDPSFCRTQYLQGNNPDVPGGCAKALNEIIAQAITRISNNQLNETASSFPEGRCETIAAFVENDIKREQFAKDAGCDHLTDMPDFIVRGVPITGPNAEEAIPTGTGDRYSACYPTWPKTNNLTRVFSYNITLDQRESGELIDAMDGETPVWTGYWKMNYTSGDASVAGRGGVNWQDVYVDMVCLRPVNMNSKLAESMSDGSPNEDGTGAGVSLGAGGMAWSAVVASLVGMAASLLL